MTFDDIVGSEGLFYGIDNYMFKFNDTVYEVIENPDDGYRSYMDAVEVKKNDGIFFRDPLAIVRVQQTTGNSFDGYELVDVEDKHIWLTFGTDETDHYYPYFCFNYSPKKVQPKKIKRTHDHQMDPFDRLFDPRDS